MLVITNLRELSWIISKFWIYYARHTLVCKKMTPVAKKMAPLELKKISVFLFE